MFMQKHYKPDEITRMLADADRDLAKGLTVHDICRKLGIAQTTYYRWRLRQSPKPSPSNDFSSSPEYRQLQSELLRMKTLVADLSLDKAMLQDVLKKKW